jgi:adenylylsulfate kinase
MSENIVPVSDSMMPRREREERYRQRAKCFWFTGLPGSGKSTLAVAVETELLRQGYKVVLLDGDNVRSGLNAGLGFTDADRHENIRRVAEANRLLLRAGIITLNSFVSPTEELRRLASGIIGQDDFRLIWVSTPQKICEKRDVKGHYAMAKKGDIGTFTGVTAPFEIPAKYFLNVPAHELPVEESLKLILLHIFPQITI